MATTAAARRRSLATRDRRRPATANAERASIVVYNPATPEDAERIKPLLA
jgi:hypothetical protein